jgi:cell division septation protein DedD
MTVRWLTPRDLDELQPSMFAGVTIVAIVPVTTNIDWAADCTWRIAKAAAGEGRRVALADLSIENPALDGGAESPPTEGIVDAFLYGASLGHVAQAQRATGLHYIGAGGRAADPFEVWSHPRWNRLAQGFAQERALLLAFIPPMAIAEFAISPDAIVVLSTGEDVGAHDFSGLRRWLDRGIPVMARVSPQPAQARAATPAPSVQQPVEESTDTDPAPPAPEPKRQPAITARVSPRRILKSGARPAADKLRGPPRVKRHHLALAAAVGAILVVAAWFGPQLVRQPSPPSAPPERVAAVPAVPPGSVPSPAPVSTPDEPEPIPAPPASDSLFYGAQVAAFSKADRAISFSDAMAARGLEPAVSPVSVGGGLWYRVILGAFPSAAAADSMRKALWNQNLLEEGQGTVLRTPHALDVGTHGDLEAAETSARGLRERLIPAYVLSAPDGHHVLIGAFERTDQAAAADSLLAAAGITATLILRLGIRR